MGGSEDGSHVPGLSQYIPSTTDRRYSDTNKPDFLDDFIPSTEYSDTANDNNSSSRPSSSASGGSSNSLPQPSQRESYMRPCSFLQPGLVFSGKQSFTAYITPPPAPPIQSPLRAGQIRSSSSSHPIPHRRHEVHPTTPSSTHPHPRPPPLFTNADYASTQLPSWSEVQSSAIDPYLQALLSGAPSYRIPEASLLGASARASNATNITAPSTSYCASREEWEVQVSNRTIPIPFIRSTDFVQVSISSVDYERGTVRGIMKALNVPQSPSEQRRAQYHAATYNDAGRQPHSRRCTVTTSFEGEIVDLHNHSLWTRVRPPGHTTTRERNSSSHAHSSTDNRSDKEVAASESGSLSWLASNATVDKTTDLEYWARLEAFTALGPSAEKEICRIAREGSWVSRKKTVSPSTAQPHSATVDTQHDTIQYYGSKQPDPRDYLLMRWKERDFIDCDALTSGLTISGFYYICLNRNNGHLTGVPVSHTCCLYDTDD